MQQRWVKFDWSIALVVSVLVHGGLVWWMLQDEIRSLAQMLANGISTSWTLVHHEKPDGELGDENGAGTSIADSPGEQPASGMAADMDQPFLSRDPAGMGHVGDAPSKYTGPTGAGAMASAMQQAVNDADDSASMQPVPTSAAAPAAPLNKPSPVDPPVAAKPAAAKTATQTPTPSPAVQVAMSNEPPADAIGVADGHTPPSAPQQPQSDSPAADQTHAAPSVSDVDPPKSFTPADSTSPPPADSVKPTEAVTPPHAASPPSPPVVQNSDAMNAASAAPSQHPGLPVQSADPAPQSDSEIDPFSQIATAEFRSGKNIVRTGRKATLTRPHIPLAGFWDGVAMGRAVVTLDIVVDPTGRVIDAHVIKSSGSNEIDNPIAIEAWNWTFAPDKNVAGEPVKTEFPFTVAVFR